MPKNELSDVCEIYCIQEEIVAKLKKQMLDKDTLIRLAETFKILGDPTRVQIIHALSHNELCVCDIVALIGMSQSAVSHQLRVLRNCRLVKFRKDGKVVYYSIDDSHITNLFNEGLDHVNHDRVTPTVGGYEDDK